MQCLRFDRPYRDEVRRLVLRRCKRALAALHHEDEPHAAIFSARRSLKRARALFELARPLVEPGEHRKIRKGLRDAGRQLAEPREIQIMIETLRLLVAGHKAHRVGGHDSAENENWGPLNARSVAALSRRLKAREAKSKAQLVASGTAETARLLEELYDRLRDVQMKKGGMDVALDSMRATYAAGQKLYRRAYRKGEDESFHEWRKAAQFHWHHAKLLREVAPEQMVERAENARAISRMMGADHDIADLLVRLEAEASGPESKELIFALSRAGRARQLELRAGAERLGALVYEQKPKEFRGMVEKLCRRHMAQIDGSVT